MTVCLHRKVERALFEVCYETTNNKIAKRQQLVTPHQQVGSLVEREWSPWTFNRFIITFSRLVFSIGDRTRCVFVLVFVFVFVLVFVLVFCQCSCVCLCLVFMAWCNFKCKINQPLHLL